MNIAVKALTKPGDGIIIQRPVYPPFTATIEGNERVVRNNALKCDAEGYYKIDFEDFEAKAKEENTTMFILCNPHNPTGRIFSIEELKMLSDICAKNNVIIVADEIHGDLIRKIKNLYPLQRSQAVQIISSHAQPSIRPLMLQGCIVQMLLFQTP